MPSKTMKVAKNTHKLKALFPCPDDGLTAAIISAFVLRADLRLELDRISEPNDSKHDRRRGPALVSNQFYSRFYFFRGTLRSMHSAETTLRELEQNATFTKLLQRHGIGGQFAELCGVARRSFSTVAPMRNFFGAHAEGIGLGRVVMKEDRPVDVERSDFGISDSVAGEILIESLFIRLTEEKRTKPGEKRKKTIKRVPLPPDTTEQQATASLLKQLRDATMAVFKAVDVATYVYLLEFSPPG